MVSRIQKNKEKVKAIKKDANIEKSNIFKKIGLKILLVIISIIIILLCFYLYARFVGTRGLMIYETSITNKIIPKSFEGIKIIHISDIHFNNHTNLDKIVKETNKYKPDIIVFTGDLVDKSYKLNAKEKVELISSFSKIDSTLGKYYINGESDNKDANLLLNDSGFKNLNNTYDIIYNKSLNPILLTGLDELNVNIDEAFSYYNDPNNEKIYTISLVHNPKNINEVVKRFAPNLILSGHTHNYHINIPLINKQLYEPFYESNYNIGDSEIFISGGIGTNEYNVRLFNHPSINVYRMEKNK